MNSNLSSYAPTELATLSNYPIGSAPSAGSNQNHLYLSSEMCGNDSDLAALNQVPHVQKEQLTVIGYLGRGAFGEVFRGLVQYSDGQNEKVAIKVSVETRIESRLIKLKLNRIITFFAFSLPCTVVARQFPTIGIFERSAAYEKL